jgi:hypothetical protein
MSVIHLTGDASLLERFPPPSTTSSPTAGRAAIRRRSGEAARSRPHHDRELPQERSQASAAADSDTGDEDDELRRCVDIPPHYAPFLMEELAIEGADAKYPHWKARRSASASRACTSSSSAPA